MLPDGAAYALYFDDAAEVAFFTTRPAQICFMTTGHDVDQLGDVPQWLCTDMQCTCSRVPPHVTTPCALSFKSTRWTSDVSTSLTHCNTRC